MRWIPGIMLALMIGSAAAEAADAGGAVPKVRVQPLTYGAARVGTALPVCVTVSNATAFTGQLAAWIGQRGEGQEWRQLLDVGPGQFMFYVYPQQSRDGADTLHVVLESDVGRPLQDQALPLSMGVGGVAILTVPAAGRRIVFGGDAGVGAQALQLRDKAHLPDQWFGYRGWDAVVWDASQPVGLSGAQRQALEGWIVSGGRLVLCAAQGDGLLNSPVPGLVPALTLRGGFYVAELPVSGSNGLLGQVRCGLGTVAFLRADYASLATCSSSDGQALMGICAPRAPDDVATNHFWANYYAYSDTRDPLHPMLYEFLTRMSGYQRASFWPILVLLSLYTLTISVVDYLVLKRLKRLPWTWITFPALIAVFSLGSFLMFYKGRMGELSRYEVQVTDVGPDGRGISTAYACIRNNSHRAIEVEIPSDAFMSLSDGGRTDFAYGRTRGDRMRILVETDTRTGRRALSMPAYLGSFRFFREQKLCARPGPLFDVVPAANGALNGGQIKVLGAVKPDDGFLYADGRTYVFGKDLVLKEKEGDAGEVFYLVLHGNEQHRASINPEHYAVYCELRRIALQPLAGLYTDAARNARGNPYQGPKYGTLSYPMRGGGAGFFGRLGPRQGVLHAFVGTEQGTTPMAFKRLNVVRQWVEF